MPTPEFAELVSAIEETIDQVFTTDSMMIPDPDQTTDATGFARGPAHAYVLDFEKIIWHYPDALARIIEDTI